MRGVLVDTSVWVEHFRSRSETLVELLAADRVLIHPLVLGEIACGTPPMRTETLTDLSNLQHSQQASHSEVMALIERHHLYGLGCGWIDLSLLASTLLTDDTCLWTLDKRLDALAQGLGVAHSIAPH